MPSAASRELVEKHTCVPVQRLISHPSKKKKSDHQKKKKNLTFVNYSVLAKHIVLFFIVGRGEKRRAVARIRDFPSVCTAGFVLWPFQRWEKQMNEEISEVVLKNRTRLRYLVMVVEGGKEMERDERGLSHVDGEQTGAMAAPHRHHHGQATARHAHLHVTANEPIATITNYLLIIYNHYHNHLIHGNYCVDLPAK